MFKIAKAGMFGLFPLECCFNVMNPNKLSLGKIEWLLIAEFSRKSFPKPSRNHKEAHAGRSQNRGSIATDRVVDDRNLLSLRGSVLK
jgi:hypothetical protein